MDAIRIASRRMYKLTQLFPNDICMCYVSAVGLGLFCGLELHQQTLMAGILLFFQKHNVALYACAGVSASGRHQHRTSERAAHLPWNARLRTELVVKGLLTGHAWSSRADARAACLERRMARCMDERACKGGVLLAERR